MDRGTKGAVCALLVGLWLVTPVGTARAEEPAEPDDVAFEVGPFQVLGNGPHRIAIGGGVFDFRRVGGKEKYDGGPRAEGRLEAYSGTKLWILAPMAGVLVNHDGGVYGWGGASIDVAVGSFRLTPALGLGGYNEGDSKDLGGVFQFYTGGTVSYVAAPGVRVGITLGHISNAYIHDDNPGEESLLLTLVFAP